MEWKNVGSGRFFQHIQMDPADSQALSLEKCWKQLLLPTYSNGPSQLMGIQTDPGPLFSYFTGSVPDDSLIQFSVVLT